MLCVKCLNYSVISLYCQLFFDEKLFILYNIKIKIFFYQLADTLYGTSSTGNSFTF